MNFYFDLGLKEEEAKEFELVYKDLQKKFGKLSRVAAIRLLIHIRYHQLTEKTEYK